MPQDVVYCVCMIDYAWNVPKGVSFNMIWHNATPDEVLTELGVDKEKGLSGEEAKKRLDEYGKNYYVNDRELSLTSALTTQLKKPSVILLLSLLVIFVLRELVLGTNRFWIPITALIVLGIKEAIAIYSEYRCVNMLFRLRNRLNTSARVIRSGQEVTVDAVNVVPGDIIVLSEGDFVPADARLIESTTLRCDEAMLFNEKEEVMVEKYSVALHDDHSPVEERSNMVYCGCHIMTGSALAVVTETGENAEIRRHFKRDRVFTHKGVQDRITDRFSGFLRVFNTVSLIACLVIIALGTFAVSGKVVWGKFLEAAIVAVSFYIAVVPENFAARVACMLALGVKRLEVDRATIFDSSTVEKLAGVTVICADKTGTLTQNKMVMREVFDGEKVVDLSSDTITKQCEVTMRFASLSCDSVNADEIDHTEAAMISASARYLSIVKSDFDSEFPRVTSIPLTPERKIKTSVNMIEGNVFSIVRGAPDIILERCLNADKETVTKAYEQMCSKGMRVLAISYKILDDIPSNPTEDDLEYGLEFLGLMGFSDRERKGTSNEIALCRSAGISTVMFTGDHINTATSVAEQMGILANGDIAVTGEHLDELSDEELLEIVPKIKVCARISPEQRVRIVNALHAHEETVLITADSAANHAPMAIADVGCGMGRKGTDVAKGNADVVIDDDRFVSIVRAIKNSRGIFANFTKYAEYYVTMCCCMFTVLALCMIFFGTSVLSPQLLLLSSIFTFIFPMSALGFETADNSTMEVPPWNIGSKMFDVRRLCVSAGIGVAIALPSVIVYLINNGEACAAAAAFMSLVISLILYAFTSRSAEFLYKRIFHNRFLMIMCAISVVVVAVLTLTAVSELFSMTTLCAKGMTTAVFIPFSIPVVFELLKLLKMITK